MPKLPSLSLPKVVSLPKLPSLPKLSKPPKLSTISALPKRGEWTLPKLPEPGISDATLAHVDAIVGRLIAAARGRANEYLYGFRTARDIVQLAGSGATLWLLYNRKRAAIPFSVATSAIVAGLSGLSAAFDKQPESKGEPDVRDRVTEVVVDSLANVMGAVTLLTSKSVREELTGLLDLAPRDPFMPFGPWAKVRNLVSLYATYTMVGHWAEMAFCQLIRLGVVGGDYDRSNTMLWDWWLHPFPAEGIAGLLIALLLNPLRERLLILFGGRVLPALALSFLANQVACTSIDYLTGMVANRNYELWDYREMPFNFQGQICLQNSLVYTTAATAAAWLAYPAREAWLRTVPDDLTNLTFAGMLPVYAFLCLTYFL